MAPGAVGVVRGGDIAAERGRRRLTRGRAARALAEQLGGGAYAWGIVLRWIEDGKLHLAQEQLRAILSVIEALG